MAPDRDPQHPTPFERGNQNQTTDWKDCIGFYERLSKDHPGVLRFFQIGVSDGGLPMHAGVVSSNGQFDGAKIRQAGRPIFFNNNGIHPGEPEGIDACMALVRDFCTQPERLEALGDTVFLFIPVYNVDGCMNRQSTSRVNQLGPEHFGFRANGRNLDLNRDFIKCDSLAAQAFSRFFTEWDPDVMVDTHTSNGADYQYTMTLIHTQTDKLGEGLGTFLRDTMLPAIYLGMQQRGWPTCPYVNPVKITPDDGIEDFLEVPRFSTGYAALHHCIGFMPETHMLKPYADRYASMRALVETVLALTVANARQIQSLRHAARQTARTQARWPVRWRPDYSRPAVFRFKGYAAVQRPSALGAYSRLAYDRSQPWERDIAWYNRCVAELEITTPRSYLIPRVWREVIDRLQWNGVQIRRLEEDQILQAQVYRIAHAVARPHAYEGHLFYDQVETTSHTETFHAYEGDVLVDLDQPNARYAVETLEPQAHDSFFRWGFFSSVMEKKEAYSDYVFEDTALEMLHDEPALRAAFEDWKLAHPEWIANQEAVLDFIFTHGRRFHEPEWRRYPVLGLS